MNIAQQVPVRTLQRFEPDPEAVYSIEAAAHLARVERHRILVYCKQGLVSTVSAPEHDGYRFNDEAIRALRQIEYLQTEQGINFAGTRLILELLREVERLRNEVRFLSKR